MFQEQLTQALSPQDFLFTQTVTNTTVSTSPGIDFSKFNRGIWYVEAAAIVAGTGVLAIQPQSSPNPNFVPFHNMINFTITNMSTNNTVTTIEVRGDQVTNQNAGDKYVRLNLIDSTNGMTVTVIGLGGISKQGPASQYSNTSIVTTVVCTT